MLLSGAFFLQTRTVVTRQGIISKDSLCCEMIHQRETVYRRYICALLALALFPCSSLMAQEPDETYRTPVAQVLEMNIYTGDPIEMQRLIVTKLLEQYIEEQEVDTEVSTPEAQALIVNMELAAVQQQKQRESRRREIILQLESTDQTDAQREQLMSELDSLYRLLENSGKKKPESPEGLEPADPARIDRVKATIRQWKINKALYQKYGGRIIYGQSGPVPLDAYREYLQEQEEQGKFAILNKEYEELFWNYFISDSLHTFYEKGSRAGKEAFAAPRWVENEMYESP
jgi:hypothetical protein